MSCTPTSPVGRAAPSTVESDASSVGPGPGRSGGDPGSVSPSPDAASKEPSSEASSFPGPRAGSYRYRLTVTDAAGATERREQTRTYAEAVQHGGRWRQENVQLAPNGDFTTKRISLLEWRRGGVFLMSRDDPTQTIWSDGRVEWESRACSYHPPQPVVRFPLEIGRVWSASGACRAPDGKASFTYATTWEVIGSEQLSVEGHAFDCFVIEERQDDAVGGATRSWHAPELGLTVKSESVGSDRTGNRFVLDLIRRPARR